MTTLHEENLPNGGKGMDSPVVAEKEGVSPELLDEKVNIRDLNFF